MQITGATGTITKLAVGNNNVPIAVDLQANMLVSEYHSRFYNLAYQGNLFGVANQAAVTTSTTLNTTFTGLAVSNPAGSGVNLVIQKFLVAQFAVGAAAVVSIAGGLGSAAGTLIPRNALVGNLQASKAIASAGATITAPVLLRPVGSVGSLATTGYALGESLVYECNGDLIVPPGSFVCTDTSIATTTSLVFGFVWAEIPV